MKETVLEKSTNTHKTTSPIEVIEEMNTMSTQVLKAKGESVVVEHGHHNTVATNPETTDIIKITQQEFNPLLKEFQNAFD